MISLDKDVLESIEDGVILTDTSARVTFANRSACRMLQVPLAEILGKTLLNVSTLGRKGHELILYTLQTLEPILESCSPEDTEGVYLSAFSSSLKYQKGAFLIFRDKTSDYRIHDLGKEFIAGASHELRTPITIIRGFAETLQDFSSLSAEMIQEITDKIVRTCGRLDQLIGTLLTLSDLENLSTERFKFCNLVLLVENCKYFILNANPEAHIKIKTKLKYIPVMGDPNLIELAIINVLKNSIKYSPNSVEIEIEIEKQESQIRLNIRDRGIGIAKTDLPHIFNRFYMADKARSRKSGGVGLGLSVVKTIMEKHQGQVSVLSELGRGSTFTLSFPVTN